MDPQTLQMLIYAGLAVGGYAIHWFQARNAAPAPVQPLGPGGSSPPLVAPATPPGHIQIGHGALLNLLLGALSAGASGTPGAPTLPSAPSLPASPATPGQNPQVDIVALLQMFLTHLQQVTPPPTAKS